MLWFEGEIHEGTTRAFDLADRGLTLGDGIFDTALSLNGRVAFGQAHLDRLAASAKTLGFAIDRDGIGAAMTEVATMLGSGSLRTTVTRGTAPRGLAPPADPTPVWWISTAPRVQGSAFAPVSLLPTDIRRNETSPAAGLKTLGYLDAVLATKQARAAGFDESLFLNTQGRVACAGTGNLFAILDGCLVTPPRSDGVLPGIIRHRILALARELGIALDERSTTLDAWLDAEAVFITNSLRCLSPVVAIGTTRFSPSHRILDALAQGLRRLVADACNATPEEL